MVWASVALLVLSISRHCNSFVIGDNPHALLLLLKDSPLILYNFGRLGHSCTAGTCCFMLTASCKIPCCISSVTNILLSVSQGVYTLIPIWFHLRPDPGHNLRGVQNFQGGFIWQAQAAVILLQPAPCEIFWFNRKKEHFWIDHLYIFFRGGVKNFPEGMQIS